MLNYRNTPDSQGPSDEFIVGRVVDWPTDNLPTLPFLRARPQRPSVEPSWRPVTAAQAFATAQIFGVLIWGPRELQEADARGDGIRASELIEKFHQWYTRPIIPSPPVVYTEGYSLDGRAAVVVRATQLDRKRFPRFYRLLETWFRGYEPARDLPANTIAWLDIPADDAWDLARLLGSMALEARIEEQTAARP